MRWLGCLLLMLHALYCANSYAQACDKGEKRLNASEPCIPQSLFNYLYCLQQSGGGKVQIIQRGSGENKNDLEIAIGGKGSGVLLKGEASGKVQKSEASKAADELQVTLDPNLAKNCARYLAALKAAGTSQPPVTAETRTTNCSSKKTLPGAVECLEKELAALRNARGTWHALDEPQVLGKLTKDVAFGEFKIPSIVPADANEVLVYAWFASGFVGGAAATRGHWRIYTYDGAAKYSKYLHWFGYGQNAYGFNSDNFWLPLTTNRRIVFQFTSKLPPDQGTNVEGEIWLLGYR